MVSNKKKVIEFIIYVLVLLAIYSFHFYNYLLFHVTAELLSIIIGIVIFIIAWNARKNIENHFFLVLGIASLHVSAIDLIHTLTYKGMNIILGYTADLPTQFWVVARFMQAVSFIIALFFINRKVNVYLVFLIFFFFTFFLVTIIFLGYFPSAYIESQGLTPFKIISEYVIIAILFISLLGLHHFKEAFDRSVYLFLSLSLVVSMFSDFFFTQYISVYDEFNLIGHLLKIVAFYLIYKAIVEIGFSNPLDLLYRKLKVSEEQYKEAYNRADLYKDIFTHDMSNILQVISSSLELANPYFQEDNFSPKLKRIMKLIEEQVIRGSCLVNNIRKLTVIEEKGLNLEKINILEYLALAIKNFLNAPHNKEVKIEIDWPKKAIFVQANELLIDIFDNFFLNATNYNYNNLVQIEIKISESIEDSKQLVKLEFLDNGIGILDEQKKLIFQKGQKGIKGGKGMGIGLSLVLELMVSFGGKVWVENREEGDYTAGSNFVIVLQEVQ